MAGKTNMCYMALSSSKYVNKAEMMRELGRSLVIHCADLQSYSRCNSAGVQNERDRKDEHTLHGTGPVKVN